SAAPRHPALARRPQPWRAARDPAAALVPVRHVPALAHGALPRGRERTLRDHRRGLLGAARAARRPPGDRGAGTALRPAAGRAAPGRAVMAQSPRRGNGESAELRGHAETRSRGGASSAGQVTRGSKLARADRWPLRRSSCPPAPGGILRSLVSAGSVAREARPLRMITPPVDVDLSNGSRPHPATPLARRSRLHPTNSSPRRANHNKTRPRPSPQSLRNATEP